MSGLCCQPPCVHHEAIKIKLVFVLLFTKIITYIYTQYTMYILICSNYMYTQGILPQFVLCFCSLAVHFGMDNQRSTMICVCFLLATNLHHSILYTFVWPMYNWNPVFWESLPKTECLSGNLWFICTFDPLQMRGIWQQSDYLGFVVFVVFYACTMRFITVKPPFGKTCLSFSKQGSPGHVLPILFFR